MCPDVMPQSRLSGRPTIQSLPTELDKTISILEDPALAIEHIRHSDECYTLVIFHLSGRYRVWRAFLSLDLRWTLSPADNARVFQIPDAP